MLLQCLKAIFAQVEPADEVIVLDNGSTDGTCECSVVAIHYLPGTHLTIFSEENVSILAKKGMYPVGPCRKENNT